MPVVAETVGLADRMSRRRPMPKRRSTSKRKTKPGKSTGCAAGSGLGALRLLLEASGRADDSPCSKGGKMVRPQSAQSAPSVVGHRNPRSVMRQRPTSACTAASRPRSNTWSSPSQHVAQYSSPLSVSGPLLRPRSAPSGGSLRERRLGLTLEDDPDATSWESLQASKVRVASITDRLEYLKRLQDGVTDISMKQAEKMNASYKSRSRMQDALKHAGPRIEQLLDRQRQLMRSDDTATRRLNELHRFVLRREEQRLGQAGAKAARASACSDPNTFANSDHRFDFDFDFEVTSAASQAREASRAAPMAADGTVSRATPTSLTDAEAVGQRESSAVMAESCLTLEADLSSGALHAEGLVSEETETGRETCGERDDRGLGPFASGIEAVA